MRAAAGPVALTGGPDTVVLDLGHEHPAAHGSIELALTVDDGHVVSADPGIGFMHRGAEKLFEARDYRQILMLANRHDWQAAFAGELGVALAVERMLGLDVPPRAVWLRTLCAELTRITSHLAYLGAAPLAAGYLAPALRARDAVQSALEEFSGGRVHYMLTKVGGLREDIPPGWTASCRWALAAVRDALPAVADFLGGEAVRAATSGIGTLTRADALAFGVSGPVARASGLDLDLRRDDPYLAYADLGVRVVTRAAGDCAARWVCLYDQVSESVRLAGQCLTRLPAGPVAARTAKVVRAPEGACYVWTESPLGISGVYLVSRGKPTPWRLKLRTPSFSNVAALTAILPGTALDDVASVLASVFFVAGDLDR